MKKHPKRKSKKSQRKSRKPLVYPETNAEAELFKKAVMASRIEQIMQGTWLCQKCGIRTVGSLCKGGIPLLNCKSCTEEHMKGHWDCDQCRLDWHSGRTGNKPFRMVN